jgi:fatty acid desaturase
LSLASTVASSGAFRTTTPRTGAPSGFAPLLNRVKDAGLLRRSQVFYISLLTTLVLALGGAITGFILLGDSWFQLLIAAALGVIFTQFAFLGHEASHRQVFTSGKANDRMGRALASGVVGLSYSWWMNKHTRHHGNSNVIGKDPDLEIDTVSFVDADARSARGFRALITRHQSKLFFVLLGFEGINLHVKSFLHAFGRGKVDGRSWEISLLVVRMAIVVGAVFFFLPLGMAFAFLGVQLVVFGLYMGLSFAPNHIGMTMFTIDAKPDFLRKQVLSSRNIRGGLPMTALMGGLNYQIEHHLFPSMARPQLAAARRMVRETCARDGIAYTETTLVEAYRVVLKYMKTVGLSAPRVFECPVVLQYGRL